MAAQLGVGQRFLPGQAALGPMGAPVAWQLDAWGLPVVALEQTLAGPRQHRPSALSFSCCIGHSQPQTIRLLFITCPVAATVTDWLCRLWQAMTGYLHVFSDASL